MKGEGNECRGGSIGSNWKEPGLYGGDARVWRGILRWTASTCGTHLNVNVKVDVNANKLMSRGTVDNWWRKGVFGMYDYDWTGLNEWMRRQAKKRRNRNDKTIEGLTRRCEWNN